MDKSESILIHTLGCESLITLKQEASLLFQST